MLLSAELNARHEKATVHQGQSRRRKRVPLCSVGVLTRARVGTLRGNFLSASLALLDMTLAKLIIANSKKPPAVVSGRAT